MCYHFGLGGGKEHDSVSWSQLFNWINFLLQKRLWKQNLIFHPLLLIFANFADGFQSSRLPTFHFAASAICVSRYLHFAEMAQKTKNKLIKFFESFKSPGHLLLSEFKQLECFRSIAAASLNKTRPNSQIQWKANLSSEFLSATANCQPGFLNSSRSFLYYRRKLYSFRKKRTVYKLLLVVLGWGIRNKKIYWRRFLKLNSQRSWIHKQ